MAKKKLTPVAKFREHVKDAWRQAELIRMNAVEDNWDKDYIKFWLDIQRDLVNIIDEVDK